MIDNYYNQAELELDEKANYNRVYTQCEKSVLDTIADPNIQFDENGISNYYYEYLKAATNQVLTGIEGVKQLEKVVARIKQNSGNKQYDCILGLSGGVDSTYLCLLAKRMGLNPLVVHCDNGWNSELAQHNIEQTVKTLEFDLFTYVIDWREFKEMQLAYLRASVVDIEVLTDHAFMTILYEQARKWGIKFVLAGMNIVTEHVLPSHWIYNKGDVENIKDIIRKFGSKSLQSIRTFPFLDYKTKKYCTHVLKMEVVTPLNLLEYNYNQVKEEITRELGWRDYGGKHYESVWTRFYQGYILPRKFNIDKRKAHYSNLIFSGQMTKEEASELLGLPIYGSTNLLEEDYLYVIKKLGITSDEFEKIMSLPRKEHSEFRTQQGFFQKYPIFEFLKPITNRILR